MSNFGSPLDPEGVVTTKKKGKPLSATNPFPGEEQEGATSAVTGGSPEDMNQMPPDIDPRDENPIYDGSDLPKQ